MSNFVIGNGLLAKAFKESKSKGCVFFCSGVSNSNEDNVEEFNREEKLLRTTIEKNSGLRLIYFSSVLVDSIKTPYFEHKKNMEKIIESECVDYLILRISQVAGISLNNNTLLSNFSRAVFYGKEIKVFQNATRNLIDVDDVVRIFDILFNAGVKNKIINLCSKKDFKPSELIYLIERSLGRKTTVKFLDRESLQVCNCIELNKYLAQDDVIYRGDYLKNIVEKYVRKIVFMSEYG